MAVHHHLKHFRNRYFLQWFQPKLHVSVRQKTYVIKRTTLAILFLLSFVFFICYQTYFKNHYFLIIDPLTKILDFSLCLLILNDILFNLIITVKTIIII